MHISTKCSIAIHCLIFINEYGGGTKVTSTLLSKSTGCNSVIIRNILSALKKEKILNIKQGTGGATLNISPNKITLYQIFNSVEPKFLNKLIGIHDEPSPYCPVGRNIHGVLNSFYEMVERDIKKSLESITLESIIEQYHKQLNFEEA